MASWDDLWGKDEQKPASAPQPQAKGVTTTPATSPDEDWKIFQRPGGPDSLGNLGFNEPQTYGTGSIAKGFGELMTPGQRRTGASNILEGTGEIAAPVGTAVALGSIPFVGAPAALGGIAGGALGSIVGGLGGNLGAAMFDADPETQRLMTDIGGTVGGIVGGKFGPGVGRTLMRVDPRVAVTRALRPLGSDPDFSALTPEQISTVKALNPGLKKIGFDNGELNLIPAVNKAITAHQEQVDPWLQRMEGTVVPHDPIVQATRGAVGQMLPSEQAGAQGLILRADQDYANLSPAEMRARLALINERMSPFYRGSPSRQSELLADIPDAVLKAQRDAIANALYQHLDPENAGAGPRLIQERTGPLIDLRTALQRRNNAMLAQEPVTPLERASNAIATPVRAAVQHIAPGIARGTGLSYGGGAEGAVPMLNRAFAAVSPTEGANEFGMLPRPGPRLLGPPTDTSGPLPPGYATARNIGEIVNREPRLLPPANSGIGVSGTIVPDIVGTASRGRGGPQGLLPPSQPGSMTATRIPSEGVVARPLVTPPPAPHGLESTPLNPTEIIHPNVDPSKMPMADWLRYLYERGGGININRGGK